MGYDPTKHHRRSIRLPHYDYSRSGAYFITICVQERLCLFGEVQNEQICLSPAGRMIQDAWDALPERFPFVTTDAFIVMPNHVHGIVWLNNDGLARCTEVSPRRPMGTEEASLGRIVQGFKSLTTNQYINGVKQQGWPRFNGRVWQSNYFEHVIRDDDSLAAIQEYIDTNPLRWPQDQQNPQGDGTDDVEAWVRTLKAGEDMDEDAGAADESEADEIGPNPDDWGTGEHKVRPYGESRTRGSTEYAGRTQGSPLPGRTQALAQRIGHGYDLHRLQPGGALMLGGIEVSNEISPVAHSDGDVVIHALVDALLGAMGWGDIGEMYPNTDPQWKGAASRVFLEHVYAKVMADGYALVNADITILAERPKLKAFKPQMRDTLQRIVGGQVNIKAGTNEECDAIGRGEAIAAHAVVLLARGQ